MVYGNPESRRLVHDKMASSEVSEVLYTEEDISMVMNPGLDMPVECVQEEVRDSPFPLSDNQIIYGDQLIVTCEDVPQSEEIVGADDPLVGLYDGVPVPLPTHLDNHAHHTINKFGKKKPGSRRRNDLFDDYPTVIEPKVSASPRPVSTWQQKQVSIKTLEGEFSVTMWASGADDGKKIDLNLNFIYKVRWRLLAGRGSRDMLSQPRPNPTRAPQHTKKCRFWAKTRYNRRFQAVVMVLFWFCRWLWPPMVGAMFDLDRHVE